MKEDGQDEVVELVAILWVKLPHAKVGDNSKDSEKVLEIIVGESEEDEGAENLLFVDMEAEHEEGHGDAKLAENEVSRGWHSQKLETGGDAGCQS